MSLHELTLTELSAGLAAKRFSSREVVDALLSRIEKADDKLHAFTEVYAKEARAIADGADAARASGFPLPPLHGLPVAYKDLCDIAGRIGTGGSKMWEKRVATETSNTVERLTAAGMIPLGKLHMVEFAFGGWGTNPLMGTPWNPWDLETHRTPGGSSSGTGVAVAARLTPAGIGSDTGGSVRIPAAVCGLVGFKPTARRVGNRDRLGGEDGIDDGAILDRIGERPDRIERGRERNDAVDRHAAPLAGLRFAIPKHFVMDELDPTVAKAFERACAALAAKGVKIEQIDLVELNELPAINAKGGFAASEAYAWHKELIARRGPDYDPFVHPRIMRGKDMSAADYIELLAKRADLCRRVSAITSNHDAVIMPTCAIVAPTIDEVSTPEGFTRKNLLLLRNTTVGHCLAHQHEADSLTH